MRKLLLILAVFGLVVLVRMSFFTVDPTEYVYVTQLGEPVATYDGADNINGAGLHWRWPWPIQTIQRLDRRLQYFDLPVIELLTRDAEQQRIGKTLVAETYACWRIADREAVDLFIRRIGTAEQARTILGQLINAQLSAQMGRLRLEDLITTEPGQAEAKMEELCGALQKALAPQARTYGIELVDVRLRRFNHPASVRPDIFARIKSERQKMAQEIRSRAETEAKNLESKAQEEARTILAKARYEEETLKGKADTEAAQIRNQAHSRDPEFYVFLKKMEKLHSILGNNKTMLLLSSHRALFDLLFNPPQPGRAGPPPAVAGPAGRPPAKLPPAKEVRRETSRTSNNQRKGGQ
jgi:membrane protease subunit HflC